MKTLLICGGRSYADRARVFAVLDDLYAQHRFACLVHGGAPGADTLADEWGHERMVTEPIVIRAFLAEWRKYGASAGPRRNADMLRIAKPDLVVAFPGGRGTADMVSKARKAGVPVMEVDVLWSPRAAAMVEGLLKAEGKW